MVYKVTCNSQELISYALKNTPALIIDCANAADPHTYFPYHNEDSFDNTYILSVDLLYKFRDSLLKTQKFIQEKKIKVIVVTSYSKLFHYNNDLENKMVLNHCYEIMRTLSKKTPVIIQNN